jgi:glycosyltransferase involved in cell wall biosynthesis
MNRPPLNRVAFVGNYVPRRCGLATFTRDVRTAVAAHLVTADCPVIAMDDRDAAVDYPSDVRFVVEGGDPSAYRRAAEWITLVNADVVSLQHEYGIFGGVAGGNVVHLLRELMVPVHTTLHTVLAQPSAEQRRVMDEVLHLSARVAVMTQRGRDLLQRIHGVASDRIDVIPHGIPDTPFTASRAHKKHLGLADADVLLTFGLLSPGKGIEHVIEALPQIVTKRPNVVYLVVGATHPRLVRDHGEAYRHSLMRLVERLGVGEHVVFHDRYVDMPDLLDFLAATDIYVTPYLNEDQVTSGTLAYAFGCGKAIISTPYWHARELLADGRGVLVPFQDSSAIAREVCELLADEGRREAMRQQAWDLGREMVWSSVAARYAEAFAASRLATMVKPRGRTAAAAGPGVSGRRLPSLVLDHLWRLTDATGLLQHATFDVPARSEGYCTDDNARALALMVNIEELGLDSPASVQAATTYAAFLGHAFDARTGRFHNLMDYDRRWLDTGGSDDCLGRAIVALGLCIGRTRNTGLRRFACRYFEPAVRAMLATDSPRGWALAIIGIRDYLERLHGDRFAHDARRTLTDRLLGLHDHTATPSWPWLEDIVTYENARPCQALISSGCHGGHPRALDVGLALLEWLFERQLSDTGRFSPVGCRGFDKRGGTSAMFDQQPIEAQAMVAACHEAFRAVGDPVWADRAWTAFEWFHGHNVLGTSLCNPRTGGCRDGLLEDRANENQGAESTLAYLAAILEMRLLETMPASAQPTDACDGPVQACRSPS